MKKSKSRSEKGKSTPGQEGENSGIANENKEVPPNMYKQSVYTTGRNSETLIVRVTKEDKEYLIGKYGNMSSGVKRLIRMDMENSGDSHHKKYIRDRLKERLEFVENSIAEDERKVERKEELKLSFEERLNEIEPDLVRHIQTEGIGNFLHNTKAITVYSRLLGQTEAEFKKWVWPYWKEREGKGPSEKGVYIQYNTIQLDKDKDRDRDRDRGAVETLEQPEEIVKNDVQDDSPGEARRASGTVKTVKTCESPAKTKRDLQELIADIEGTA